MGKKFVEEYGILCVLIVLVLGFSYCAIPLMDKSDHQPAVHEEPGEVTLTEHAADDASKEAVHEEPMHAEPEHAEPAKVEPEHAAPEAAEPAHEAVEEKAAPATHEEPAHDEKAHEEAEEPAHEAAPEAAAPSGMEAVIMMENPAYSAHKKKIVPFTHQKHIDEYKISCGQCHHDENNEPLELAVGDDVQSCADCHSETKTVKGEKLSKEEKIAKYHKEALHANCINCHKAHNEEVGGKGAKGPAPSSCAKCHTGA